MFTYFVGFYLFCAIYNWIHMWVCMQIDIRNTGKPIQLDDHEQQLMLISIVLPVFNAFCTFTLIFNMVIKPIFQRLFK